MKPFELSLTFPVVEFIQGRNRSERRALAELLNALKKSPHACRDIIEPHLSGRDHFVFLRSNYAIKFWIDDWECEVKVLNIQLRDR